MWNTIKQSLESIAQKYINEKTRYAIYRLKYKVLCLCLSRHQHSRARFVRVHQQEPGSTELTKVGLAPRRRAYQHSEIF